jgi:transcriptional regulator with XRE-family HTH domain
MHLLIYNIHVVGENTQRRRVIFATPTRAKKGSTMATKTTFGKKLRECREDKGLSQQELAKILKTSHSVIGRYERDEMSPSIDAVKKMAATLDTTVGYLLGESNEGKTLKDTAMLKRLNDISALPDKDKEHILYTIDGLIKSAKLQAL